MAFPTSSAQQAETNRKILEDIQLKKQLLQKGAAPGGIILSPNIINQPTTTTQLLGQPTTDFLLPSNACGPLTAPRLAFNPTSASTLGYFIQQDSYFGNTFIPVLPRLEPLPTQQQQNATNPNAK